MVNNYSSQICHDLLLESLSPSISIVSSQSADGFASKLGHDSFYHLIRPFGSELKSTFNIKNTQLITNSYKSFSVRFTRSVVDMLTIQQNDERNGFELFRIGELNQVMENHVKMIDTKIKHLLRNSNDRGANDQETSTKINMYKNSLYPKLISQIYSNQLILPFETFNHPIIHLIVLTSQDSVANINEILAQNGLNRKKHLLLSPELRSSEFANVPENIEGIPEYLDLSSDDDSLICFLILVDELVAGDEQKCVELKSYVKKNFYYPCLSLKLNDTTGKPHVEQELVLKPANYKSVREELEEIQTNRTGPYSHVSEKDYSSIRNTLVELVKLNLIPFMEKKISYWDDLYIQPRKSITNRFFSASKRYFSAGSASHGYFSGNSQVVGSKPYSPKETPASGAFDLTTGYYKHNSPENIIRKLADWAFMLKDYKYAYSTYDLLKKDFNTDKAWTYFASCQEMAALSLLFEFISGQTSSSTGYYNSIKQRLELVFQIIDSANYNFLSRCNLRSFSLRFQLTISELFNCLKINTFSELNSGSNISYSSTYLYYNNIYSIKYLNDIIAFKLLNYNLVDTPKRTYSEERSYYILKALVMERISYSYSVFLFNHSKYSILLDRGLLTNTGDMTYVSATLPKDKKPVTIFKKDQNDDEIKNPYKLEKPNLAVMGLTRYRKAGFWLLLSLNQWNHLDNSIQLKLNIDKALEYVYGFEHEKNHTTQWLHRVDGLLGRFIKSCDENLNVYIDSPIETSIGISQPKSQQEPVEMPHTKSQQEHVELPPTED